MFEIHIRGARRNLLTIQLPLAKLRFISFWHICNMSALSRFKSLCFLFLVCVVSSTHAQGKKPKAVFIIVDGIPADVIEKLQPVTLTEISRVGGYTRSFTGGIKGSYNETPTISAPGYNNLLTGVWGNKHNVRDNDIEEPNYNYWNIFRIAEFVNPSLRTAVFSTWTDNRTKLIGERLPEAGAVELDYSFDGLEIDSVNYPHDAAGNYIHRIDSAVAVEAAKYIAHVGPDLSWVYLQHTDDVAHKFGDDPRFYDAVLGMDRMLKGIWDSILLREQTFDEDWLIVVTTDHGRDARTGKNHGGQSDRERTTWIVTNAKNLNGHFKQTPAVVDILPSVCNHLGLKIPEQVANELDGTPFIGSLDFSNFRATRKGTQILLEWKSLVKDKSDLEISIAVTNNFRKGEQDSYLKTGSVPVSQGRHSFSFQSQSEFFKVVVRTKNQTANTWVK